MIAVNPAKSFFDKVESRVPDKGTISKYPGVLLRDHPFEKQLPGTIPVCSRQRRHKVVFDNHSVEGAVTDFFSGDAYHYLSGFVKRKLIGIVLIGAICNKSNGPDSAGLGSNF